VFSAPDTGTVCKAAFPGPTDPLTDRTLFHITECSRVVFQHFRPKCCWNLTGLVLVNTSLKQCIRQTFHHIFISRWWHWIWGLGCSGMSHSNGPRRVKTTTTPWQKPQTWNWICQCTVIPRLTKIICSGITFVS